MFSCPSSTQRQDPASVPLTDHTLAVPSQLPLTSHGSPDSPSPSPSPYARGGGSIHDRLVTALACPTSTNFNSCVFPSMTRTLPSLHPVAYTYQDDDDPPISEEDEREDRMAEIWWGWRVSAPPGWMSSRTVGGPTSSASPMASSPSSPPPPASVESDPFDGHGG